MKENLFKKPKIYWLINPLALSIYTFLLLIILSPNYFEKYEAEVVSSITTGNEHIRRYYDLNSDGPEELIYKGYNGGLVASFYIRNSDGNILGQWNFKGKWLNKHRVIIGDYNHNSNHEIYCLHVEEDSLLLSVISPYEEQKVLREDRFIAKVGVFDIDRVHVDYVGGKFIDVNNDGFEDFVFVLYGGYSKFPRKVFTYDVHNDSLYSSPETAAGLSSFLHFKDLDGDGVEEVLGRVSAHENIHYPMPYTDSSTWLMVHQLFPRSEFLFPPIEFECGLGSYIRPVPVNIGDRNYIACGYFCENSKNGDGSYQLLLFNRKGTLVSQRTIITEESGILDFINPPQEHSKHIYLIDETGSIYITDTTLKMELFNEQTISTAIQNQHNYNFLDIDGDGLKELFLSVEVKERGLLIYSSKLDDPVLLEIPSLKGSYSYRFSTRKPTVSDPSNLVISTSERIIQIQYDKNPFYPLRFLAYLIAFSLIFLFFWLLQKAQNILAQKRFETEKQLMQQQMALSKKQMEPHFILNTVNNIGYLFMKEDKKKAIFYLGKFAALMRRGLMNADKVSTSLEEEIEFVEDYLVLQKQLMDGELDYRINIDENVEGDKIQIPHSLIYTFVENAIKHGLRPKANNRTLRVIVSKELKRVKISIQDNGVGRAKSKELKTTDTGKGLEIVKTIITGYNKLHGGDISYLVEDVLEGSLVVGTLVDVWV